MTTMTTKTAPKISFNQWLTFQHDGPFAALAKAWTTTRGRLTRQTVIDRAGLCGVSMTLAAAAYDAYLSAVRHDRHIDFGDTIAASLDSFSATQR
jgi:hypothetical protein